jgi:hypothetical protein
MIAAILAGLGASLVSGVPSALIVAVISLGALGEPEYARLGPAAILGFVVIGALAGSFVYRRLDLAWSDMRRRPADLWIAFAVMAAILFVGVLVIPALIVFITVDSDHGLAERASLVEILWYTLHGGLVVLAFLAGRWLFETRRPGLGVDSA